MRRSRLLVLSAVMGLCSTTLGATTSVAMAQIAEEAPPSLAVEVAPSDPLDPGSPVAPERDLEPFDVEAMEDVDGLVEIEEERTAASRTYLAPDGTYRTMLTTTPINYQRPDGSWVEIDNSWLPVEGRGANGGWTNGANSFDVEVPASLDAPFTVTGNGASIAFTVAPGQVAADGAEAPPADDPAGDARSAAVGELEDDGAVTFPVSEGLSLRYTAISTGVKEELVIESSDAARSINFDVQVSGGDLRRLDGGSLGVVGPDGTPLLTVPPPFAIDADLTEGPASLTLEPTEGGHRLTLSGDDGWLDAPDRAWPVVLDPLVQVQGATASTDCFISSGNPTGRDCTSQFLRAGYESGVSRQALLKFPDLDFVIPRNTEHVNSMLRLTAYSHSNPSGSVTVQLRRATKPWDTNLTWQKYNLTSNWATTGGDFDSTTPEYVDAAMTEKGMSGTTTGSFFLSAHRIVSDWLERPNTNYGFVLAVNPWITNDMVNFRSSEYATTTHQPSLWVNWKYRDGMRDSAAFEDFQLTDRSGLFINYANLNTVVAANEFNIQGTGHNLDVTRYYNGRNAGARGWTWSIGADTYLEELLDGSIVYHTARGEDYLFIKKKDGTFFQPPGLNGTLTRTSADDYTVTMNRSNFKIRFERRGDLLVPTRLRDRNSNDINWYYTVNAGYPEIDYVIDTQGRTMDVTWTDGRITSISDWEGRTASYTWNGVELTTARDAGNADTDYTYDGSTRLTSVTTPEGRLTTIVYEATSSRVDKVQRRLDGSTAYTWDFDFYASTARTRVIDPNLHTVDYFWSSRDKIVRIVDGLAHVTDQTSFTNNEDALQFTNGTSGVFNYSYSTDGNNNLQSIQSPSSGTGVFTTSFQYNTASSVAGHAYLRSSAMDPQGKCQSFRYDSRGNLTRTYDGATVSGSGCSSSTAGARTDLNRNGDGTIDDVTDPVGNVIDYGYDSVGNLTGIDYPSPLGDWTYTPDGLSRTRRVVDGEGQQTDFTFDNLDRIVQITYDGDTGCTSTATCTTFAYDDDGKLLSRTDSTGATTFTYDGLGRLRTKALPGGANACAGGGSAMTLDYDGFGNLTSYCDAQGTVTYAFDEANRMVGMAEPGGSCVAPKSRCVEFIYDDDGRQRYVTYPTATPYTVEWQYAPGSSYVTRVIGKKGTTPTFDVSYSYSTGSNDTQLVRRRTDNIAGNLRSYQYDGRNRLCWTRASATHSSAPCSSPPSLSTSFSYDANGNRTTEVSGGTTYTYRHNAANQLCWRFQGTSSNSCGSPPAGAEVATYDANGAMATRTGGFSASYNPLLQTDSVTHPGGSATAMSYSDVDATERTSYGATSFDNGPLGLVRSTTGGNTVTWTRTNQGMLVSQHRSVDANARYYYVLDRQGTVAAMVNGNGDIANTYNYTATGQQGAGTTQTVPNPFRFHGGYQDNIRSLKFGTRYYDPTTGRFSQLDALAGSVADPANANRYAYAANNPVAFSDPTGYSTCGDGSFGGFVDCVANPTGVTGEAALNTAFDIAALGVKVAGCVAGYGVGSLVGQFGGGALAVATGGTGALAIPVGGVVGGAAGCGAAVFGTSAVF